MESDVLCCAAERMQRQITAEDGARKTVQYLELLMEEHNFGKKRERKRPV